MATGCTIWLGMFGSGWLTGMMKITITTHHPTTPKARLQATTAFGGAAPFTSMMGTLVPLTGEGTFPITLGTTVVSAAPWMQTNDLPTRWYPAEKYRIEELIGRTLLSVNRLKTPCLSGRPFSTLSSYVRESHGIWDKGNDIRPGRGDCSRHPQIILVVMYIHVHSCTLTIDLM